MPKSKFKIPEFLILFIALSFATYLKISTPKPQIDHHPIHHFAL